MKMWYETEGRDEDVVKSRCRKAELAALLPAVVTFPVYEREEFGMLLEIFLAWHDLVVCMAEVATGNAAAVAFRHLAEV